MRPLPRLAAAFVIALLLPFPGPHSDAYTPIAAALFRRDALEADWGFWLLAGVVVAVYTAVVFGVMTLIRWVGRRKGSE